MPVLTRPDGAEIHWEERGEGQLVLIAHQILWSYPGVYAGLIDDLAADHRVVTYDPRGCGRSSRHGPYEVATDVEDLQAVVQAANGSAIAVAVGFGFNLVVRVAARRPDLISDVLTMAPAAAAVLPRSEWRGSDVIAGSDSVVEMISQMMSTDPRAAVRVVIAATNPELNEDQLRERVDLVNDYITNEASIARVRTWLEDDTTEHAQELGDRLWILHGDTEALFEGELTERVSELFPEANIEQLPEGAVSRPDLAAARVRGLTASRA
jgi:pimeloyl-ACP methyl ester carboxylesterase